MNQLLHLLYEHIQLCFASAKRTSNHLFQDQAWTCTDYRDGNKGWAFLSFLLFGPFRLGLID
jgi:hypothetical protein